jgi:hypothetical protein
MAIPEKLGATVVGMFFIPMLISAFWNEGLYEWIAVGALVAGAIFVVVDELILKSRGSPVHAFHFRPVSRMAWSSAGGRLLGFHFALSRAAFS